MEPSELVNILTTVLAVSIVILAMRLFRGDISDNKGGLVIAMVVLGVVIYFIRSDAGLIATLDPVCNIEITSGQVRSRLKATGGGRLCRGPDRARTPPGGERCPS